jgi:hypothetical protein
MPRMNYVGRARIGDERTGSPVHVSIDDVEEPRWEAVVLDRGDAWRTDEPVRVTLVDEGLYEDWSASALVIEGAGGDVLLRGEEPLTPPVGASRRVTPYAARPWTTGGPSTSTPPAIPRTPTSTSTTG